MNLLLERRSEIALRSLRGVDRSQVVRMLDLLQAVSPSELPQQQLVQKVRLADSQHLFIARAGRRLRLLLSLEGENCRVLDIVDHDRLERILLERGVQ